MLRWGIVSTGNITHSFIHDLLLLEDHKPVAVASRDVIRAEDFAKKYEIPKAYGDYTALFLDPNVDIVYIATPHNSHSQLSTEAMQNGKHVLCEKPSAVNQKDLREVIALSQEKKLFYMEAFWSRFNPALNKVFDLIKEEAIGKVTHIHSDFSFYRNDPVTSRLLNMDLAGGSLLDMGVYPIFLSYMLLGLPRSIKASALFHETGADVQTSVILEYERALSSFTSGFLYESDMKAKVFGTQGHIIIENRWHEANALIIHNDEGEERLEIPKIGKGYAHEILACGHSIARGENENNLWSHQDSLNMLEVTDRIRKEINLIYPFE